MALELQVYSFVALFALTVFILERIFPAVDQEPAAWWWPRALLLFGLTMAVGKLGDLTWMSWIRRNASLDLFAAPAPALQGFLCFLLGSFFFYWWHRWRHEVMLLWDLFHQMHHSPKRVETLTAYYVHPAEGIISSCLNGLIIYGILGGNYEGFLWSIGIFSCVGIGYHSNLKTPRFLDYLVQTPEMHRLHHKRGVHEGNYSDLPIWDILFGTFRNPKDYPTDFRFGFREDLELKFWDILRFRNVLERYRK
ncbi:MAG: sterol desaturase family protein [Deltaproteobacteria bacterium]|nr:sterol desaturase family protein [Deltaproteobacteria bacterium]MBT6434838.1 sterol desaturase family protein [Deltaproteobacteria bacterium]MBT6492035.1 sterol desaturase family protein [Deltaproteobacteria bacterium]